MLSQPDRTLHGDVLAAGLAGAICSAFPSTAWSLVRGDDVLDGARAAGGMLLPDERRTPVLLLAAVPVHLALSLGWAGVLAATLPRGLGHRRPRSGGGRATLSDHSRASTGPAVGRSPRIRLDRRPRPASPPPQSSVGACGHRSRISGSGSASTSSSKRRRAHALPGVRVPVVRADHHGQQPAMVLRTRQAAAGCMRGGSIARCRFSSNSAASGRAKRRGRTAPLPGSRSLPLRPWSSSSAGTAARDARSLLR
jgi:hypothetical protein